MIITAIIGILLGISHAIAWAVPTIPNTPESIIEVWNAFIVMVVGSLSVLGMIFTPQLVIAVFFVTITVITWGTAYGTLKFIWRKIPFLNQIKL